MLFNPMFLTLVVLLVMIGSCVATDVATVPARPELPLNKQLGSIFNDDGADGISTFNWTPYHRPEIIRHPGRAGWGIGAKLVQEQMCQILGSPQAIKAYLEQPRALGS